VPIISKRVVEIVLDYFRVKDWPSRLLVVVFPASCKSQNIESVCENASPLFVEAEKGSQDDDLLALQAAKDRNALLFSRDQFRNHARRWEDFFGRKAADELKIWCAANLFPFEFHGDTLVPNAEALLKAIRANTKAQALKCFSCKHDVALASDIINSRDLSGSGTTETNPAGTTFTFLKVRKLCVDGSLERWQQGPFRLDSEPRTENSFFPGYGWSLLFCSNPLCDGKFQTEVTGSTIAQHLGWKFRLVRENLDPVWKSCTTSFHWNFIASCKIQFIWMRKCGYWP
jgi:hypothetical protein